MANLSNKTQLFNLEYWQGNHHESTITYNRTKPQLMRLAKDLKKDSRYKIGKFKFKEVN